MAAYVHRVEIAAPMETVFGWLSEREKVPLWAKGVEAIDYVSGSAGQPGARFKQRIREGGRVEEYEGEVLASEPPRLLATRLGNRQYSMRMEYRLHPSPAGTLVEHTLEMEPGSRIARVMGVLFGWLTRGIMKRQMARLKDLAEADRAAAA